MKLIYPAMLLGAIVACGGEAPGNDTPCGDSTIAVLNDERGATYAFCAHEDTGLLVFEMLPSLAEVSYLDLETDAAALFDRVHPADVIVPDWVRESLESGTKRGDGVYRWTAPVSAIGVKRSALEGSCADPDAFFLDNRNPIYMDFIREFVTPIGQNSPYNCAEYEIFEHESWNHVIHTASASWNDGACGIYGRVLGCGAGNTVLTAEIRGTPNVGAWSEFFNFTIPSGGFGKVKGYANGEHSCKGSDDKDDFRLDANSVAGASHHFSAIYINEVFAEWNMCYLAP